MVISQHVIWWIQVLGLVASLYGFFYLSIWIFKGKVWLYLRPLMPAVGAMLTTVLCFQLFPFGQHEPSVGYERVLEVLVLIVAYCYSYLRQYLLSPPFSFSGQVAVGGACVYTIIMMVVALLSGLEIDSPLVFIASVVGIATLAWLAIIAMIWAPGLADERLKGVAFLLVAVSLLTSFLPVLFNVLRIPLSPG